MGGRWTILFSTKLEENMKEDKNEKRDAVEDFAKKFIAEHKKAFDTLKDM